MNSTTCLTPEFARRRVLPTKDAAAFLSLSLSTFRRLRAQGAIPSPLMLSQRRQGWLIGDLSDWQDCRAAGREWHEWKAAQAGNDNRR